MKTCEDWVIVKSGFTSTWLSCKMIVPNLVQAYSIGLKNNNHNISLIDSENLSHDELFRILLKLKQKNVTGFVFLDHFPFPEVFLNALKVIYLTESLAERPNLWFHIYGDLTLLTDKWYKYAQILSLFYVRFACASQAQKKLMITLGFEPSLISIVPFPTRDDHFKPLGDQDNLKVREELGIKPDEFIILYTGRLSLQKNLIQMLMVLSEAKRENPSIHLVLVGPYDDLGAPFFNINLENGSYQDYLENLIYKFNKKRKWIHHVGLIPNLSLCQYYSAADQYMSLSLHHDEDFGMSSAESLMCGTPCLLSGWGGFHSFSNHMPDSVTLTPVTISEAALEIDLKKTKNILLQNIKQKKVNSEKIKISEKAHSLYSVSSVSKLIQSETMASNKSYSIPIKINKTGSELAQIVSLLRPHQTYFPLGPAKEGLYYSLYSSYVNPNHD